MSTPYRVVKQRHACTVCGHGEQWVVEGPMGDMGITYELKEDALEEATALTYAYDLGYKAGKEED